MIVTAMLATFGLSFLLVWQLLNWLTGHVRWLPKGAIVVLDTFGCAKPVDPAGPPSDSSKPHPIEYSSPRQRAIADLARDRRPGGEQ